MSTATVPALQIKLPGIGLIPAAAAAEVEAGGVLLWKTDLLTTVEYVDHRGPAVEMIERDNRTGKTFHRTVRSHRALPYFSIEEAANRYQATRDADIEDVAATDLDERHIGREVSTPDGWHTLANVEVGTVGVIAVVAGSLHKVGYQLGQIVGVRGSKMPVWRCGCLPGNCETDDHHPKCYLAHPATHGAPYGVTEFVSDAEAKDYRAFGHFGCTGCLYVWMSSASEGYYRVAKKSGTCPEHGNH